MVRLTAEQVLMEKRTGDPNFITALSLTHRALSEVSFLSEFKNIERLDLGFNNLASLDGLKSCINLKWLSVVQNKLTSLKGIEGLSELTVLNAGKNKLRSMDEVKSLVSIRALILNDNEIGSICKLDQLKDLNTIVLSRNPICELGEALIKVKSITKLSLTNCQIQSIGSSFKSLTELKELRLAHNEIQTLPAELAYNKKLQNLDLGNNLITTRSDLKVLGSLVNLKNLNLLGNPVAQNDKLANKVKKLLPNLHIFNTRLVDKKTKREKCDRVDDAVNKLEVYEEERVDQTGEKDCKHHMIGQIKDGHFSDHDVQIELKKKRKKTNAEILEKQTVVHEEGDARVEKRTKKKILEEEGKLDVIKRPEKIKPKEEQSELDFIDDREISFVELFAVDAAENPVNDGEMKTVDKAVQHSNSGGGSVTYNSKRKKTKKQGMDCELHLPPAVEIGLGGPSAWDD
ncbi:LRR_8 domain-containing protein [Cephalotus follicularis]|uniref:LRR_8 domain-containing protein n=1 Tax=Cephalotus follicularis TaxID=3775 RepID=A0A1Q3BNZ8_CEPFO|nr:LRR_8 domain-containing protein [Cephalotus follicularis]